MKNKTLTSFKPNRTEQEQERRTLNSFQERTISIQQTKQQVSERVLYFNIRSLSQVNFPIPITVPTGNVHVHFSIHPVCIVHVLGLVIVQV